MLRFLVLESASGHCISLAELGTAARCAGIHFAIVVASIDARTSFNVCVTDAFDGSRIGYRGYITVVATPIVVVVIVVVSVIAIVIIVVVIIRFNVIAAHFLAVDIDGRVID
jgi:hypothetical protein